MAESVFLPTVIYRDDRAALEWLTKAFGFETSMVVTDESGQIVHAEMKYRDAAVTIAREYIDLARSPRSLDGKNSQTLGVAVEGDVDAHCARAKAAGAVIVQEPADQFYGDRTYRCMDPEGHLWVFSQAVKVVSIAQMEQATGLTIRETL